MNVMAKRNDRFRADIRWYTHVKYIVYIYIFNVILYIYIYLHTYMIYGTWIYDITRIAFRLIIVTIKHTLKGREVDTQTRIHTYAHICTRKEAEHIQDKRNTPPLYAFRVERKQVHVSSPYSVLRVSVVSHEISFFFFFFSFVVARVFHEIEILACCCWLTVNRRINVCQEAVCEVRGTSFASTYVGVLIFQSVVEYFKTWRKE